MFTKKSLSFFALMLPLICNGQVVDIKLTCDLSLTTRSKNGVIEREKFNDIFEVYQDANSVSILPSSPTGNLGGVTTNRLSSTISINNYSDTNKWSVKNVDRSRNHDSTTETVITIDRNSGQIFYYQNFRNGNLTIEGQGTCKKIDTTKRLF
jgi:hypothetical protein